MREVSFKVLVGSHNYNLATPDSDKDYKVFYYPTFGDLFYERKQSKSQVTDEVDTEWHDVRRLVDLFSKGNLSYLEVLFSQEIPEGRLDALFSELYALRSVIAKMNLPRLYDACRGMVAKDTKKYKTALEMGDLKKAGKAAASAIRIANFVHEFQLREFKDFEGAIRFDLSSTLRRDLLKAKRGELTEDFKEYVEGLLEKAESTIEAAREAYKAHPKNETMESYINVIVQRHVARKLRKELKGFGK